MKSVAKKRNCYLDNVKAILIFLVVLGHFIYSFVHSNVFLNSLYDFIYFFHMPLFILVSSFFSKKIETTGDALKKSFYFLKLYIISQIVYTAFNYFFIAPPSDVPFKINFMSPFWITWFLFAFAVWTLIFPYLKHVKHPVRLIVISFIVSVFVGFLPDLGTNLSLSRIIVFLPFVLIGYFLPKKQMSYFENSKQLSTKVVFAIIAMIIFIATFIFNSEMYTSLLYGSANFWAFKAPVMTVFFQRIIFLIVTLTLSLCLLVVTGSKHRFYTETGKNTLYIYLFHGFFVKLSQRFLGPFISELNGVLQIVIVFALSIIVIVIINLIVGLFRSIGLIK